MIYMDVELFLKKHQDIQINKSLPKDKVNKLIEDIEKKIDFEIFSLIRKIVSKEAESFTIRKGNPDRYVFIGNGSDQISINYRSLENEMKLSIPKTHFKD